MSNYVLDSRHIQKVYRDGKQTNTVLADINLAVEQGQKVAILGLSGSGKTTLLNMLGGLDRPTKGQVFLAGQRFDNRSANGRALLRNHHLGFIYQLHHLLPEFSALQNVMMPLMLRKKANVGAIKQQASQLLQTVGLSHRVNYAPAELSGGERQRVAIARALVTQPDCVLADEPTGNLDETRSQAVFDLMCQLSQQLNTSFIVVTHDQQLAQQMDVIYQLHDGVLVSIKKSE